MRIVALPDVRKQMLEFGSVPLFSTPEEFAARIEAERPYWAQIIKEVGIQAIE